MNALGKIIAAAVPLALGVTLAAAPAAAQGWRDYGYSRDDGRYREPPPYGWGGNPYYGVDAGVTDIAICPGGYHLGRSGRLCWPD